MAARPALGYSEGMLREQGEVRRIEGQLALVALRSHGGCGSCSSSSSQGGSCQSGGGGGSSDADRLVTVVVSLPVRAGDRVELAVPDSERGGKRLAQGLFLAAPALVAGAVFERLMQRLTGLAPDPLFLLAVAGAGLAIGQALWSWRQARTRPRMVKILPRSLPMVTA
jgi:hypothetical protein